MHWLRSIYDVNELTTLDEFIHRLDENGTVIIQEELSSYLGKKIGDMVNITTKNYGGFFPDTSANYRIVGIMDVLPGIILSWEDQPAERNEYAAVISWNTYFNLTRANQTSTTGYFWIDCDDSNNANLVRDEIRDLYLSLGAPWNTVNFDDDWGVRTVLDETVQIREILNLVLIVLVSILFMALIISIIGLIISMLMSVAQRSGEIGILRALGISKGQIIQMIAGETLIISTSSLITGIICGLITAYLLSQIPFLAYVPVIFTIRWENIAFLSIFMLIFSLVAAIIPAIKGILINIIESIRRRSI